MTSLLQISQVVTRNFVASFHIAIDNCWSPVVSFNKNAMFSYCYRMGLKNYCKFVYCNNNKTEVYHEGNNKGMGDVDRFYIASRYIFIRIETVSYIINAYLIYKYQTLPSEGYEIRSFTIDYMSFSVYN